MSWRLLGLLTLLWRISAGRSHGLLQRLSRLWRYLWRWRRGLLVQVRVRLWLILGYRTLRRLALRNLLLWDLPLWWLLVLLVLQVWVVIRLRAAHVLAVLVVVSLRVVPALRTVVTALRTIATVLRTIVPALGVGATLLVIHMFSPSHRYFGFVTDKSITIFSPAGGVLRCTDVTVLICHAPWAAVPLQQQ